MRAVRCNEYGPVTSVVVEELDDLVPGEGQIVVDVAAAALNFPDVLLVANLYQFTAPLPFTPGSEFAGVVSAVCSGVQHLSVGDRVMGAMLVGALAEQIVIPAQAVQIIDDNLDFYVAAASGVAYRTAFYALRSVGKVERDDWVVVLGAAGGVGLAAVELGAVLGARVIAAASTKAKLKLCSSKGATEVINYEKENLKDRIKEITDGGAHVVIDPVGGPYAEASLRALRWGGRFVSVGFASGEIPKIPLNLVLLKGVNVTGFTMEGFSRNQADDELRDRTELDHLLSVGAVSPHVSSVYSLAQAAQALGELADRTALGKVLIDPRLA